MSKPKAYNTFSEELKRVFGCKVQRISVDAGFSCPNRDGTLDYSGCVFCGGYGSGSHGIKRQLSITGQLHDGSEVMRRKYRAVKFLAYFQAYTNTYAPVENLRRSFEEALSVEDVEGIIIATRPDCLSDQVLDLLSDMSATTYLWIELGMQSMHDRSLELINRRHDFASTVNACHRLRQRGIKVCVHIILGLPGESRQDMLATAQQLNCLGVDGVKLHLLHVMKNTRLAEMYRDGMVAVLDRDEYAGLICDFLELLNPGIFIHRLTGDGGREHLVAPLWSLNKFEVLNLIDAEFARRGTRQGSRFGRL